ncbi:hypothetical protein C8R47DRAFT_1213714 [Mycena vitilis]|nr:hypothetical protein C8R47DRAFT_1213714 [Mycena vitilis]
MRAHRQPRNPVTTGGVSGVLLPDEDLPFVSMDLCASRQVAPGNGRTSVYLLANESAIYLAAGLEIPGIRGLIRSLPMHALQDKDGDISAFLCEVQAPPTEFRFLAPADLWDRPLSFPKIPWMREAKAHFDSHRVGLHAIYGRLLRESRAGQDRRLSPGDVLCHLAAPSPRATGINETPLAHRDTELRRWLGQSAYGWVLRWVGVCDTTDAFGTNERRWEPLSRAGTVPATIKSADTRTPHSIERKTFNASIHDSTPSLSTHILLHRVLSLPVVKCLSYPSAARSARKGSLLVLPRVIWLPEADGILFALFARAGFAFLLLARRVVLPSADADASACTGPASAPVSTSTTSIGRRCSRIEEDELGT